jgi:hypothetical protein
MKLLLPLAAIRSVKNSPLGWLAASIVLCIATGAVWTELIVEFLNTLTGELNGQPV